MRQGGTLGSRQACVEDEARFAEVVVPTTQRSLLRALGTTKVG